MIALQEERNSLMATLEAAPDPPNVVTLHPAALKRYAQQLDRLQEALSAGVRSGDTEAAAALRDLIETVTVRRDDTRPGGVEVEITGRLNSLLGEKAYPNRRRGVCGKAVAEEGYGLSAHGPSVRYRLRSVA